MLPLLVSFLVFLCVFGAGFLAMRVRAAMPEHHLTSETKDTVKLAMGLVATMTALVLGLLVASAKGTYDAEQNYMIQLSSKIVVLDRLLYHYGPEAAPAREKLHSSIGNNDGAPLAEKRAPCPRRSIPVPCRGTRSSTRCRSWPASDPLHQDLKTKAQNAAIDAGQLRWLILEQSVSAISIPLLVVVCWLSILFFQLRTLWRRTMAPSSRR